MDEAVLSHDDGDGETSIVVAEDALPSEDIISTLLFHFNVNDRE